MSFFHNLNQKLAALAAKQDQQDLVESKHAESVARSPLTQALTESDYSAKRASAGADIGKPGKNFAKIAAGAAKRYGSKAAGERVAGAVLNKLRHKTNEGTCTKCGCAPCKCDTVDEAEAGPHTEMKLVRDLRAKGLSDKEIHKEIERIKSGKPVAKESSMDESALQAYIGDKKYGKTGMDALRKAGREHAGKEKMSQIRNRYNKMDEADMDEGNAFTAALKNTPKGGKFKVGGKEFTDTSSLEETGMEAMTPKQKSFAKLAPPADKITFADKIAGAKKEVDEMLGDVAAEAMRGAIASKKEPRSKGTAFDADFMKQQQDKKDAESHSRYNVQDTGYSKRYSRKPEPEAEVDTDAAPKGRGRPKGPEKAPERVTKGSYKFKSGRPAKTNEGDQDPADSGEYDQEGESAKCDIKTIVRHAQALYKILGNDDNLPEWVQSKLAKIEGMMTSVDDYMQNHDSDETDGEEAIAEKAVSKKQQKFMGMAHAMQKGDKVKGASPELKKVAKTMKKGDVEDFAKTKQKGLPEKAKAKKEESKEEVEETTTSGSVATATDAPKAAKGGMQFGKGVYESLDRQFKQALTEGMSVNVSVDEQGKKTVSVNATDTDAEALADLLKMSGLQAQNTACGTCGTSPCGCNELDENSPDWPTNTEKSNNAFQYSGGLNGPKSTGQSTTPVLASQLRRQVSMEESATLERSLFKTWKNYKG